MVWWGWSIHYILLLLAWMSKWDQILLQRVGIIIPRISRRIASSHRVSVLSFRYCRGNQRSWWRNQMETLSALLALCAGNWLVTDEIPAQRPVTPSFDIFFDLRLNNRLSKQSWGRRFETLSRPLWRQSYIYTCIYIHIYSTNILIWKSEMDKWYYITYI